MDSTLSKRDMKNKKRKSNFSDNDSDVDENGNLKGFIEDDSVIRYEDGYDEYSEDENPRRKKNKKHKHKKKKKDKEQHAGSLLIRHLVQRAQQMADERRHLGHFETRREPYQTLKKGHKRRKSSRIKRRKKNETEDYSSSEGHDNSRSDSSLETDSDSSFEFSEEAEEFEDLLTYDEEKYYKTLSKKQKKKFEKESEAIKTYNKQQIPLKFKILKMKLTTQSKSYLLNRLDTFQEMEQSDNEYHKLNNWFHEFNKIPINRYVRFPINVTDSTPETICKFLKKSRDGLDKAVYGHDMVKNEVIQTISQWITNPKSKGNVLALQGPMGNGKTTLVKNGLAKVLKRPFALIALGGAKDSAFLNGHEYTFEGSKCGRIVEVLRDLQCMNPIIFFDELDKLSDSTTGQEISNLLCHITDPVQNSEFQDRYFSGIDLDLSKAIFVMSFNDESKINAILKDRMHVIRMKGFKPTDKIKIARQYLIPSICDELKFDMKNVVFSDEVLKQIIERFTKEEGVRSLRRCLNAIYSKLNVLNLISQDKNMDVKDIVTFNLDSTTFPLDMTIERVNKLLQENNSTNESMNMLYI